jgi:NADH:ubiquinone oxidoreductase subunit F (NADH-binding)
MDHSAARELDEGLACQPRAPHVKSFYALGEAEIARAHCQGTACFVARHLRPNRWRHAVDQSTRVYCLGKCYAAPATARDQKRPVIEVHSRQAIVLGRIASRGARTLEAYQSCGGLDGLRKALALRPEQVIAEIEASQLRGRGGAAFPTAAKWRVAAAQGAGEKFVVANLDEGDPGAYIDRFIVEEDPFCLIEGMAIAARAVGAQKGWIYARCEYPEAIRRLRCAVDEARAGGLLGSRVLGSDLAFDVAVAVGRGSYVCGEETALLHSIEGRRPTARVRPPYVAERGLYGRPTVVNNVETLANVPWIMRHGGAAFASLGVPGSRGTKVVSLNSLFQKPGLYEIEFGMPLRQIVEQLGGGLRGGMLKGVMIGGPLAGIVPPAHLDVPFGFDELRTLGASVGHGGIIAFDEHTTLAQLIHHVFSFSAYESCGFCTPCRLGAARLEQMFAGLASGDAKPMASCTEWRDLVVALKLASLCGLGTGLADFAESIERHYAKELRACFA